MKEKLQYRYDCLNQIDSIVKNCTSDEVVDLILSLKELVFYQMYEIRNQRMDIIAMKHQTAWKHYDKPITDYDASTRSYIDKPPKSDNMSC